MGQFGEALRKERLSREIALEKISEQTRVATRYLTALEDEHFEALPGGILSKGIMRAYVRTLGLDEPIWTERFMQATQERGLASGDQDWVQFAENVGNARPRMRVHEQNRLLWAAITVLAVLLGAGAFAWHHLSGRSTAQDLQDHPVTSAAMTAPAQ